VWVGVEADPRAFVGAADPVAGFARDDYSVQEVIPASPAFVLIRPRLRHFPELFALSLSLSLSGESNGGRSRGWWKPGDEGEKRKELALMSLMRGVFNDLPV
jgi:hypothetical protein